MACSSTFSLTNHTSSASRRRMINRQDANIAKEKIQTLEEQRDTATENKSSLSPQSSVLSPAFRIAFLLYGLAVLLWLSVEDNAMLGVTVFGWAGAALL